MKHGILVFTALLALVATAAGYQALSSDREKREAEQRQAQRREAEQREAEKREAERRQALTEQRQAEAEAAERQLETAPGGEISKVIELGGGVTTAHGGGTGARV